MSEVVRHHMFEPTAQSLTNTPTLSNSTLDRRQRYEFAQVKLDPLEVATVTNGLSLSIWERCVAFDQKLDGLTLKITQAMCALDATPRQNTNFQLHLFNQTKRAGSKLDYTLIYVTLVSQEQHRRNTYLFFTHAGDTSDGSIRTYDPVNVNAFRECHLFVMQTMGKNKYIPTLFNIITKFKGLCSSENPICLSAPASHELRQFLDAQKTIRMFDSKNLRLQDATGARIHTYLAPMAIKSKLVARRLQEFNPTAADFHWSDYSSVEPFVVQVPFYLNQAAVVICEEMAVFGRVHEYLMEQPPADLVTAVQLAMFLEMEQVTNALAHVATLSVLFQSHLNTPGELIAILKAILNCLDVKEWVGRTEIQGTGATRAQGPLLAALMLGFIGSYEGLDAATDMIFAPELKNIVNQCIHFMITARH